MKYLWFGKCLLPGMSGSSFLAQVVSSVVMVMSMGMHTLPYLPILSMCRCDSYTRALKGGIQYTWAPLGHVWE